MDKDPDLPEVPSELWGYFYIAHDCSMQFNVATPEHYILHQLKDDPIKFVRAELVPKWIPVTERLPKEGEYVLVACGDGEQAVMFYVEPEIVRSPEADYHEGHYWSNEQSYSSFFREFDGITHWQPLPQPPLKESENE